MKNKAPIWIAITIGIILLYGLFNPERYPFPQCPFLTVTGWKCPGCGSQRALHQFMHGNFLDSFKLNKLFIPALGYVLYGYMSLAFFPKHWIVIKDKWYGRRAAILLLITIVFYWISRNS